MAYISYLCSVLSSSRPVPNAISHFLLARWASSVSAKVWMLLVSFYHLYCMCPEPVLWQFFTSLSCTHSPLKSIILHITMWDMVGFSAGLMAFPWVKRNQPVIGGRGRKNSIHYYWNWGSGNPVNQGRFSLQGSFCLHGQYTIYEILKAGMESDQGTLGLHV
jgi:hypothetical protein